MSAGTWNGRPLWERNDSTASRCGDIIERGMRRLGLDTKAPAGLNKFLIADTSRPARSEAANHKRGRGLPCSQAVMDKLVEEWDALPKVERDFRELAARYNLAPSTARKALRMADREVPSIKAVAAMREKRERGGVSPSEAKRRAAVAGRREARKQAVLAAWEELPVGMRSAERVARQLRISPDFAARVLRAAGHALRSGPAKGSVSPGLVAFLEAQKKQTQQKASAVVAAYDAAQSPKERTAQAISQKLKMRKATVGRMLREAGRQIEGPAKHHWRGKGALAA